MSSALREIINRLSGMNLVQARLEDTTRRIEKLADVVVDYEKRLTRNETMIEVLEKQSDKKRK